MNKFYFWVPAFLCLVASNIEAKAYFESAGLACDQFLMLLPKHPQDTQIAEGDLVLAIQQIASKEEIEAAIAENYFSIWSFSQVLGEKFNEINLPMTAELFSEMRTSLRVLIGEIKEKYKRRRPVHFDNRIQNKLLSPTDHSYPSGHSVNGLFWATLLSDLRPNLKDKLLEQGRKVGLHRIMLGVHYPSDIAAGFYIGRYIANAVIESSLYQSKRELILKEWENQIQ